MGGAGPGPVVSHPPSSQASGEAIAPWALLKPASGLSLHQCLCGMTGTGTLLSPPHPQAYRLLLLLEAAEQSCSPLCVTCFHLILIYALNVWFLPGAGLWSTLLS